MAPAQLVGTWTLKTALKGTPNDVVIHPDGMVKYGNNLTGRLVRVTATPIHGQPGKSYWGVISGTKMPFYLSFEGSGLIRAYGCHNKYFSDLIKRQ